MKKTKKKITYTNSHIKAVEKSDRIVLNESWLKGRTNTRRSWDIKLGDTVMVISGEDKGKTGKVSKVLARKAQLIVEGINTKKRHTKLPNQESGEIKESAHPIWIWKVMLVVEKDGKTVRTRIKRNEEGKRVAVKTGEIID
jgi:large subunit ribosomal protein L24